MNMTELLATRNSNLALEYDIRTQMFSLYIATERIIIYICSIPDLSFRFSKVEAHYIGLQIDEFEHGDN